MCINDVLRGFNVLPLSLSVLGCAQTLPVSCVSIQDAFYCKHRGALQMCINGVLGGVNVLVLYRTNVL